MEAAVVEVSMAGGTRRQWRIRRRVVRGADPAHNGVIAAEKTCQIWTCVDPPLHAEQWFSMGADQGDSHMGLKGMRHQAAGAVGHQMKVDGEWLPREYCAGCSNNRSSR